jgi:AcrR family transcriptional regulator
VFSERGYEGASAREIAERAGIAEALLFRNFGSKAALFTEVVLQPIQEFVEEWRRLQMQVSTQWSTERLAREFISRFYDLFSQNRGLMISYIATSVFDPDVVGLDKAPLFINILNTLTRWSESELIEPRHLRRMNTLVANRAVVGMILAMGLFGDWFVTEDGAEPRRDEVIEEMTKLILYGVSSPQAGA